MAERSGLAGRTLFKATVVVSSLPEGLVVGDPRVIALDAADPLVLFHPARSLAARQVSGQTKTSLIAESAAGKPISRCHATRVAA
jgi:hypothetical protein